MRTNDSPEQHDIEMKSLEYEELAPSSVILDDVQRMKLNQRSHVH